MTKKKPTHPRLFTYIITVDAGAAPNPFWGVCTLVICKPKIRLSANVGDWVAGFARAGSPDRGKLIYAMRVTQKMTMAEYDEYAQSKLPEKIPDRRSRDSRRFVGDAMYDFDHVPPRVRPGPHDESDRKRDLGGEYALLSEHFYYFGREPIALPSDLADIAASSRGHRVVKNQPYFDRFVEWIESSGYEPNVVLAPPEAGVHDRLVEEASQTARRDTRGKPRRCS